MYQYDAQIKALEEKLKQQAQQANVRQKSQINQTTQTNLNSTVLQQQTTQQAKDNNGNNDNNNETVLLNVPYINILINIKLVKWPVRQVHCLKHCILKDMRLIIL
ncbi:hypothetical protein [Ligilactobacillus sp. Marseille-Q7487]|uniref:hypothetical protein n=1 Tax=Ligilactobacillus sp. Marseille-Q7487 TaxID=3022128 RepID=UPI0024A7D130|nr:hypothetical protein [Ligilactobacillus sp. Marseille-Q7487]